jgi:hypothetical protein
MHIHIGLLNQSRSLRHRLAPSHPCQGSKPESVDPIVVVAADVVQLSLVPLAGGGILDRALFEYALRSHTHPIRPYVTSVSAFRLALVILESLPSSTFSVGDAYS